MVQQRGGDSELRSEVVCEEPNLDKGHMSKCIFALLLSHTHKELQRQTFLRDLAIQFHMILK